LFKIKGDKLHMAEYNRVTRDGKPSDALVFHCSDPDFRPAFEEVIQGMDIGKYDIYDRPAPSKTLAERSSAIEEITVLHGLHGFGRIILLDHIDCGGFGIKDEGEEIARHFEYFAKAQEVVGSSLPSVKLEPHLLGWDSEITG
jgi:hypothetical protein